jgi:hypothetical protein
MICVFLQVSRVQSKENETGGSRNTHGGVDSVNNVLVRKHLEKILFSDLRAGCRIKSL